MTDAEVEQLLQSEHPIVVIEAPAGCGKTYQAANYAAYAAANLDTGQVLVLTHTHAACSVVAERTQLIKDKVQIQTLDSLINQIASAYRITLALPDNVAEWARHNGYEALAEKAARLMQANPMLCRHIAKRYPIIICDEHQDSNEHQDKIVRAIGNQGAFLRVFGDPMQIIVGGRNQHRIAQETLMRWNDLRTNSECGALETPHRWQETSPELGIWIQEARASLREKGFVDLTGHRPANLRVEIAENISRSPRSYVLGPQNSRGLSAAISSGQTALYIAGKTSTVEHIRSYFGRQFPIWEGHTRQALEGFIDLVSSGSKVEDKVTGYIHFLSKTLTGFAPSRYGKRLAAEVGSPSANPKGAIPPELNRMAMMIRSDPSHVGFAQATQHLRTLITHRAVGFDTIHVDYPMELSDLVRLQTFDDAKQGYAELSQRRSRAYPKPPSRAASTIHKSKGLEAENVVVFACDADHFENTPTKANLLYVALSRPTHSLTLVLSQKNPSPLIRHDGYI